MHRLISAGCLTLVIACGTTQATPRGEASGDAIAADEAALRAIDSTWFAAYGKGDVEGLAALYAEDAVISAPGAPAARGSAAIRQSLAADNANFMKGGLTVHPAPTSEVGVSGDLGWIWNTFTVKDKAGATVDASKYVTVVARKNGTWRIIRDIWNSDNPAAPPAAAASAN